jgi:hypothetical protein
MPRENHLVKARRLLGEGRPIGGRGSSSPGIKIPRAIVQIGPLPRQSSGLPEGNWSRGSLSLRNWGRGDTRLPPIRRSTRRFMGGAGPGEERPVRARLLTRPSHSSRSAAFRECSIGRRPLLHELWSERPMARRNPSAASAGPGEGPPRCPPSVRSREESVAWPVSWSRATFSVAARQPPPPGRPPRPGGARAPELPSA